MLNTQATVHVWNILRWRKCTTLLMMAAIATLDFAFYAEEGHAQTQRSERIATSPPLAQIVRTPPSVGVAPTRTPVQPAIGGVAELDLDIDYTDGTIFNPATNQNDQVRLRSYRDVHQQTPPKAPFVAPTIEISPGETVRITLNNKLPSSDPSCPSSVQHVDTPHCFNSTNLHAHGMWVSPSGKSDNVLTRINPTESFQYEYNVPRDHPAGTFWYHPHLHGSTALQVSSGMAGVLIVKGERAPTPQSTGDVDTLLKDPAGKAFKERVVLLQQIQYACRDANGKIQQDAAGRYVCNAGQVGAVERYDQFGPGTWPKSGRFTTIGGEVNPVFPGAQVGAIERWRVVHAGVRDTVLLRFQKMRPGAADPSALNETEQGDWIAQNCPGSPLPHFALASDGLTRGLISPRITTVLQPGYREDLLMVFNEAGDFCVIDEGAGPSSTANAQTKVRKFLGRVNVGAGTTIPIKPEDIQAYLLTELLAAADRTMPPAMRQKVRDDLSNDLRLSSFAPHPDIADAEVTGSQTLQMKIDISGPAVKFEIDDQPYDPNRIDRRIALETVDEWTLTSSNNPPVGHPFHIHVNPFQVVKILDPKGADVSVTGEADDPQYANLKGAWKDTLFVKPAYQAVIRTRYSRYTGDFVLHCHILDHEDQGMMQNVSIFSDWDRMGGSLKQISAGPAGVWGVTAKDQVYRWRGTDTRGDLDWDQIVGSLKQISVGLTDVWGVSANDQIWRWRGGSGTGRDWDLIPGGLEQVSVGPQGVWGVDSNNKILRWRGGNGGGSGWDQIEGSLKQISAGPAGVWGVTFDGAVYRWPGGGGTGNDWELIGGSLMSQIFSGVSVCGVNNQGEIYCWRGGGTGNDWDKIDTRKDFKNVAMDENGRMWATDTQDRIWRRKAVIK